MNKRRRFLAGIPLLLTLMAFCLPAHSAPWPVANEACWYIHLDHQAYRQSNLGKLIHSVWGDDYQKAMTDLKGRLKIDLDKDLHDLSIFGWGLGKEFVIDMKGNLDLASMLKRIQDSAQTLPKDARSAIAKLKVTRSGKTSWLSLDEHAFLAQNNKGHIYFSPNRERLDSVMRQPAWNPAAEVKEILKKAPGQAFLTVAALGFSEALKAKAPQAAMLGNTHWVLLTLGDNGGQSRMTLNLMTESTEKAKSLYQIAQGILGMARLKMLSQNEEHDVPEFVPALLNALELTQNDAEIHLSLAMSQDQLGKMMHEMRDAKSKKSCEKKEKDEEDDDDGE